MANVTPKFFATPAEFRSWLEKHHEVETELIVGFYKVDSGKPSMTWSESVDEALCFGWIDAVRRTLNAEAYTIRFTRRRPKSIWSAINVAKIEKLFAQGKMYPAGERAYALRTANRTGVYSFERPEEAQLTAAEQSTFQREKKAWAYFESQAPSYKRIAFHWIVSAKREETRARRLQQLIADSKEGKRLAQFTPPAKRKPPNVEAPKAKPSKAKLKPKAPPRKRTR